jgi:hypothetical protein
MYEETGMPAALPEPAAVQRHLWDRERGTHVPVSDLAQAGARKVAFLKAQSRGIGFCGRPSYPGKH